MRLHARNIAAMAGAKVSKVDIVRKKISDEGTVTVERAKQVLASLYKG